jgi:manganese/zinc/iron transport system permease protein
VLFGAFASIVGSILSSTAIPLPSGGTISGLPTGPTIIVCASIIAIISFFFGSKKGLYWVSRRRKLALKTSMDYRRVLKALYMLSLQHQDFTHAHPASVIATICPGGAQFLDELAFKGLALQSEEDRWAITPDGKRFVEEVLS